jgi:hypothetical protein
MTHTTPQIRYRQTVMASQRTQAAGTASVIANMRGVPRTTTVNVNDRKTRETAVRSAVSAE